MVPGSVDVVTAPAPSLLVDSLTVDDVVDRIGNTVVGVVTGSDVDAVTLTTPKGVTLGSSTQLSGTVIGTQSRNLVFLIFPVITVKWFGTFGDGFRCRVFDTCWYLNGGWVGFVYHSDIHRCFSGCVYIDRIYTLYNSDVWLCGEWFFCGTRLWWYRGTCRFCSWFFSRFSCGTSC